MKPLEGASGELSADLQFGFEGVALLRENGSGEGALQGMMVGCREGEQVDLRDQSSGLKNCGYGW